MATEKTTPNGREAEGFTGSDLGSAVGAVLFLTAIFFLNFLARIIISPLLPVIEGDLGISHAEAGSLFLFISVGFFAALLCSGFVAARLDHRRTIVISALGVGAALVAVGLSSSLAGIRLGMLAVGLGAGLYLPSGIASLTALVNPQQWGKALAIHEIAPNLGLIVAPLVAEVLLNWVSWRGVMTAIGCTSLATGLAFARFGRGGQFQGSPPNLTAIKQIAQQRSFWIMAALFSLGIAGTNGLFSMLPLYLVSDHGLERPVTNLLIALSRISGLGMIFLAGWASDRLGPRQALAGILAISGVLTVFLGLTSGNFLLLFIFLQSAIASCFFPPAFAILSRISQPKTRSLAISLTVPAAFIIGSGVVPAGIGLAGQAGSFGAGIVVVGGLTLAGLILLPGLRSADQPTEET